MAPSRKSNAKHTGLGKAIDRDRQKKSEIPIVVRGEKATGVREGQTHRSILEQSSLDDFMVQAALANATFEAERGIRYRQVGPQVVLTQSLNLSEPYVAEEAIRAAARIVVPIPWRPDWQTGVSGEKKTGMSAEELLDAEGLAFLDWRRGLAKVEEQYQVVMTPYERNLDFWRQLWRCVERSDLLVQIVDARDPDFYRCRDLERYIQTRFGQSKRTLLLMNKSDFLPPELRRQWAERWAALGIDVIFFSALRELHRQERLPGATSPAAGDTAADGTEAPSTSPREEEPQLPPHGPLEGEGHTDILDCAGLLEELRMRLPQGSQVAEEEGEEKDKRGAKRGVLGFVGYPNVGKSSVINALWGAKKVSMSRTPGKTKHLQTLELPGTDLTLCDCPGLVFPSVVATKAHLAINGTVPIVELRDFISPVRIIVEKMGADKVAEKYSLGAELLREGAKRLGDGEVVDPARRILAGFATARQHFLRAGVPDETWAARRLLNDFCKGELLHCERPMAPEEQASPGPTVEPPAGPIDTSDVQASVLVTTTARLPIAEAEGASEDSDFSDLDSFLHGGGAGSERSAGGQGRRHDGKKGAKRRGRT